jgi:hypothetical protein
LEKLDKFLHSHDALEQQLDYIVHSAYDTIPYMFHDLLVDNRMTYFSLVVFGSNTYDEVICEIEMGVVAYLNLEDNNRLMEMLDQLYVNVDHQQLVAFQPQ